MGLNTRYLEPGQTITEIKEKIEFLLSSKNSPDRDKLILTAKIRKLAGAEYISGLELRTVTKLKIAELKDSYVLDDTHVFPVLTGRGKPKIYKSRDYIEKDLREIVGSEASIKILEV